MLNQDYLEIDASPLATMTLNFFEDLQAQKEAKGSNFWENFCELNSSAPECKIYED